MIVENFPILYQVWGSRWYQRNKDWLDDLVKCRLPWFNQLESDLLGLKEYVGLRDLNRCFRNALRDRTQIQQAIYEAHGCHLMASVGGNIRLHVPLEDDQRGNFDFQVNILGNTISGDVKTRKDDPFNFPPIRDENGVEMFGGTRTTLDPHEASRLNIHMHTKPLDWSHRSIPESTNIKQLLEKTLNKQLPRTGKTIVILGQIDGFAGSEYDLEDALLGTLATGTKENRLNREIKHEDFRHPTGIFCGLPDYEQFNGLSAVLLTRLSSLSDVEMARWYRLYLNGVADEPIPDHVSDAIVKTFNQWKNPAEAN